MCCQKTLHLITWAFRLSTRRLGQTLATRENVPVKWFCLEKFNSLNELLLKHRNFNFKTKETVKNIYRIRYAASVTKAYYSSWELDVSTLYLVLMFFSPIRHCDPLLWEETADLYIVSVPDHCLSFYFSCICILSFYVLLAVFLYFFFLVLWVGCGFWLWHSLDFSFDVLLPFQRINLVSYIIENQATTNACCNKWHYSTILYHASNK